MLSVFFIVLPCLADIVPEGIPDLEQSEAFVAYNGPGTPTLLVVPDGNGSPFTTALDAEGNVVDATITLILRDAMGVPIADYPAEDCWLESIDLGLVPCTGGNTADYNSDVNGVTQWVNPLEAAGYSDEPIQVWVNGSPLTSNNGLPLNINGPDLTADGQVNLLDIVEFSSDFFSDYHFRSDLNVDGVLNLIDIVIFARHNGTFCP